MIYILKILFLIQLIFQLVTEGAVSQTELLLVLLMIALHILKERLWNSIYPVYLQLLAVSISVYFNIPMGILYPVVAFDFARDNGHIGVIATAISFIALSQWREASLLPILIGTSILFGYMMQLKEKHQSQYSKTLDEERRLRYSLEEARNKLLSSQQEVAHLAEIKERNRIAREIHDNIGHSIAGVLIQMQVAQNLVGKNDDRAKETMELCIEKLSQALTTIRETVHNLKPREKLGIEYIRAIAEDYSFCQVDFNFRGDFEGVPPKHIGIITTMIKEALTNTSKYSKATQVVLSLEANEKYTRLLIKDNGIGCSNIREGLGLGGMRERVENIGGSLSVNGSNGFMIVCMLYR